MADAPAYLWAFVGGVAIDLFSGGPLGASSLAMMAAVMVVSIGHRPLSRIIACAVVGGRVGHAGLCHRSTWAILAALNAMDWFPRDLSFLEALRYIVLPALLYNTALMFLFLPLLNRMPESQDLVNLAGELTISRDRCEFECLKKRQAATHPSWQCCSFESASWPCLR